MQVQEQIAPALPADARPATRYLWAAVVGLLAVHAILAWLTRSPGIETGQDDAVYIFLSRSLAHGQYRDLFLVGTPPHRNYPPGYPALLALWQAVTGERFDSLVTLSIVCSTAALALTFAMVRRLFSSGTAVLCLAVLAVNPYLVDAAGRVASEAPYAMFSLLALWALTRAETGLSMVLLAGVSSVAAALTRTAGATLLIALGISWILERRFAWVATLAIGGAVAVVLWSFWTATSPVPAFYFADATFSASGGMPHSLALEMVYRFVHNAPAYLGLTLPYLLPFPAVPGTVVDNVLGAALTIGGLAAGIGVFARRWRPAALYLLAYGALLALWPWQVSRYMVPVLFLAVPAVLIGSGWLAKRFGARWESRTMLAVGFVLALNGAIRTAQMVRIREHCVRGTAFPSPTCVSPKVASFFAALDYVGRYTTPDAVFVSAKAATLFYYTGRRSLWFRDALDMDSTSFVPSLARAGAQYVLLAGLQSSEPRLADLLSADCRALSLVASFPPSTHLFRIGSEAHPSDGAACRALADYRRTNGQDFNLGPWPP